MKLHSNVITDSGVFAALWIAQQQGRVTPDINMMEFTPEKSRSRVNGYRIQLGTFDKTSGPTNSRHYKNTGISGADRIWAATYDEWGWFIAVLFSMDPDAVFGHYKSRDDFNRQTGNAYAIPSVEEVPA